MPVLSVCLSLPFHPFHVVPPYQAPFPLQANYIVTFVMDYFDMNLKVFELLAWLKPEVYQ